MGRFSHFVFETIRFLLELGTKYTNDMLIKV